MKCQLCNKKLAVVVLKRDEDGTLREIHACRECAENEGVQLPLPTPVVADVLFGEQAPEPLPREGQKTCPACGMTSREMKKNGLMGCPSCYDTFLTELRPYLETLHGSVSHAGKFPKKERLALREASLQRDLDEAVAEQRFEDAATIRDSIAALHQPADGPRSAGQRL